MNLGIYVNSLFIAVQFIAAMWLFARYQPRREHFYVRVVFLVGLYLALTAFAAWVGQEGSPSLMDEYALWSQSIAFVFVAVGWAVIIYACFDITQMGAVFIAIAGYSAQNFADGAVDVIRLFLKTPDAYPADSNTQFAYLADGMTPELLFIATVATIIVYAYLYRRFARQLTGEWVMGASDPKIALVLAIVILVEIVFDLAMKAAFSFTFPFLYKIIFAITKSVMCLFIIFAEFEILLNGRLEASAEAAEHLMHERTRQYELSRSNMDAINIKAHDIRHQIRHLGNGSMAVDQSVLDEIAHEVTIFDSKVKTGNDALDTILTEKNLVCANEGITLSCIADGSVLDFMPAADLYALFGNALENAIEATRRVDGEKRSISLIVREAAGMASIHIENYYSGEVEFVDGTPKSSKGDDLNHGFGTKSMRNIVERYGGTLDVSTKGDVYYLNVIIPIPENA